nr:AAA family ATPase [Saprospiraceae bacterium]
GVQSGIFKRLSLQAQQSAQEHVGNWSKVPRFVLIIDEINRGNLPAIFGELISLIEPDKRQGCAEQLSTILPYSKDRFSVPANLYILGTMNTADRSTESLDIALRRRFSFLEVPTDHHLIPQLAKSPMVAGVDLERLLQTINDRLEALLDEQARIGHAYFLQVLNLDDLRAVFELHILPLLKAYFYHDLAKIGLVLGRAFVSDDGAQHQKLADFDHPYAEELLRKRRFRLRPVLDLQEKDFIQIYDPAYGT